MAHHDYIARSGTFYDPDQVKRNFSALNEQRHLSLFCDVVLRVCGTQIFAHSNVLAAASPYFGSFLGLGADCPRVFSQKVPQVIEIQIDTKDGDDGYGEAVSRVIEYMYTSHITLNTSVVSQIIEISKIMQLDTLLIYCGQFQSGDDNNCPIDRSTCTSGLEEIASLMRGRSKSGKRADAATETEESIFKKVDFVEGNRNSKQKPGVSDESQSKLNAPKIAKDQTTKVSHNEESLHLQTDHPENCKSRESDESENVPISIGPSVSSSTVSTEQLEASLLLGISKVRPPVQSSQPTKTIDAQKEAVGPTDNMKPFGPQMSTDEYLKNVRTLADMMSIAVDKSEEQNFSNSSNKHLSSQSQSVEERGNKDWVAVSKDKDINLEEISDLVRFEPLTKSFFESSSSISTATTSAHSQSQSRSRGRPGRGRSRGRGRGRGRRPGRPRKVVEEDHESDPEFDALMDRLEKGDNVNLDEDRNLSEGKEINSDMPMPVTESDVDLSSTSSRLWKSRRKRFRPTQFRKDYVMHSLAKRTNAGNSLPAHVRPDSYKGKTSGLKFICQKCDFSSSVFKEYRQHMKTHPETDPRNFVCDKAGCSFKTTRVRKFNAHKHKHMIEELICPLCEHRFDTQDDFDSHQKKHEGQNPYFCTECDSRFRTKAQLLAHKPKHQLEKPFVCAICQAGFKWKHALKNHMVTHSASKDHLCDECGYATAHKAQLKAHMLVHTGLTFRCPTPGCSFQATKRQNLKYHMVTHTQEKPHQCEVCGHSFSLVKNMRRHMLLHTGARPYSCRVCDYSTTRFDKLKEHNLKLHNIGEGSTSSTRQTSQLVSADADLFQPDPQPEIAYITDGRGITITNNGQEEGITSETLQTIAHLASSQNFSENTTIIQQEGGDGNIYPIITTVELFEDADGVKYIAT